MSDDWRNMSHEERVETLLSSISGSLEAIAAGITAKEALDVIEDLVRQHCYLEDDGTYDTAALSTNRDAFAYLVEHGRAVYVGEQVGRRAFIRLVDHADE